MWRASKNVHDYKIPNDPNSNEWHNLCNEDIGQFWDLPNWDDNKYYYFQAVDLGYVQPCSKQFHSPIAAADKDEVIEDHYGWWYGDNTH